MKKRWYLGENLSAPIENELTHDCCKKVRNQFGAVNPKWIGAKRANRSFELERHCPFGVTRPAPLRIDEHLVCSAAK